MAMIIMPRWLKPELPWTQRQFGLLVPNGIHFQDTLDLDQWIALVGPIRSGKYSQTLLGLALLPNLLSSTLAAHTHGQTVV